MRWIASLVAEAHRILTRGGVFLYPRDGRPGHERGRLRYLYECAPIAFLIEQAGGQATDGSDAILDRAPASLHERTPFVFGSAQNVALVSAYHDLPEAETSALFGTRGVVPDDGRERALSDHLGHRLVGAGTTTVKHAFDQIFRREGIAAVSIEGDAFHRFDRAAMAAELKRRTEEGDQTFSHFSYEANVLEDLERVFREYGETGKGKTRHYVHDDKEAERSRRRRAPSPTGRRSRTGRTCCSTRGCTARSRTTASTWRRSPT